MDAADIAFAGAAEQGRMLSAREISAADLVQLYLDRIAALDGQLNSFRVVLGDEALAEAADRQARLDAGETAPLLGVPVAIKDDVDVAGQVTAWGTSAHGPAVENDGEVVRRLRAAGAIVIGKTNVPEMTIWPFTETKTFGATRNPWNTEFSPGGSSGGTGAAVAAGLIGLGLGSDGGGSIRIPSIWCGLFGIKPQRDRVPLSPHEDAWQGMSVNGPIARRVIDAALFLDATTTMPAPEGGFAAAAGRDPGKLRIAISTKVPPGLLARVGKAQRRGVEETAELLRSLGHEVIERDPDYPATGPLKQIIMRYLRGIHDDVSTMPHADRLEKRSLGMAKLGSHLSDKRIANVRAGEAAVAARINKIFDDVDVLMTPGTAAGPSRIGQYDGHGALRTLNSVAGRVPFQGMFNATGQPAASVPCGFDDDGVPIGVQLVGRPSDEATLISLAAQIEQARPWADRRPPVS
jgi:amidase